MLDDGELIVDGAMLLAEVIFVPSLPPFGIDELFTTAEVDISTCFPPRVANLAAPLESCFAINCACCTSGPDTII